MFRDVQKVPEMWENLEFCEECPEAFPQDIWRLTPCSKISICHLQGRWGQELPALHL